jgi:hypothetical protein
VKKSNNDTEATFKGKIAIGVVKTAQGLQITHLLHDEQ